MTPTRSAPSSPEARFVPRTRFARVTRCRAASARGPEHTMSRVRPPLVLLAVVALSAGAAAQVVHKVPQDFLTIQEAVDASGNTDQIVISAGTYAESVVIEGLSGL